MPDLQITQIDHVSVIITDVERSRRFYRDVPRVGRNGEAEELRFRWLWFALGNQQLHLLQKPQADSRSPRHFALRVQDVDTARSYFRGLGITPEETTKIKHCDRFFVYDPDGNRIEIIQWMEPYDPANSGAAVLDH